MFGCLSLNKWLQLTWSTFESWSTWSNHCIKNEVVENFFHSLNNRMKMGSRQKQQFSYNNWLPRTTRNSWKSYFIEFNKDALLRPITSINGNMIPVIFIKKLNIFRSSHRRYFIKKVFLGISQNSQENTCARVSETLAQAFPVDFAKFLRTSLLENTSGRLLLHVTTGIQNIKYGSFFRPNFGQLLFIKLIFSIS